MGKPCHLTWGEKMLVIGQNNVPLGDTRPWIRILMPTGTASNPPPCRKGTMTCVDQYATEWRWDASGDTQDLSGVFANTTSTYHPNWIYLYNFDNVVDTSYMFYNCDWIWCNITLVDPLHQDQSAGRFSFNLETAESMFEGCNRANIIGFDNKNIGFPTDHTVNIDRMFYGCESMTLALETYRQLAKSDTGNLLHDRTFTGVPSYQADFIPTSWGGNGIRA